MNIGFEAGWWNTTNQRDGWQMTAGLISVFVVDRLGAHVGKIPIGFDESESIIMALKLWNRS